MTARRPSVQLMLALVLGVALVAVGTRPAWAHADLVDSTPAAGEVLEVAPDEVTLTFEAEVGDESAFTVEDADRTLVGGGELDLEVLERNVLRGSVEIRDTGEYVVRWSATDAADGDTTTGEFSFVVGDAEPMASTRPDTAVAPHGAATQLLRSTGLLLLGSAASVCLWMGSRRRAEG